MKSRDDIKLLEDRILDIPYYNIDEGSKRTRYLKFIWMPNDEDYKEVALSKNKKGKALEVIGVRQFLLS